MVCGRDDEKSDVFAPFDLDKNVDDNEKTLLEEEKQFTRGDDNDDSNDIGNGKHNDVFADFNLDNIVRENEELDRKKREALQQQNGLAAETETAVGGKKLPRMQFPRIISVKHKNANSEGGSNPTSKATTLNNAKELSTSKEDDDNFRTKIRSGLLAGHGKQQKSVTSTDITSTSLSKTGDRGEKRENYKKASSEGSEIAEGGGGDNDNDNDNSVGRQPRHLSVDEENDDVEGVLQWESSIPEVENIFAEFDLDAIVQDYERLSRKIHGATPDDLESVDSGEDTTRYDLCHKCFDTAPRISACFLRVLLPLWFLVLLAIGLGYVLGRFEEDDEYERNDEAMKNRFIVESFPLDDLLLFASSVPAACVDTFIERRFNVTLSQNESLAPGNDLDELLGNDVIFPDIDDLDPNNKSTIVQDLLSFMGSCIGFGTDLLGEIVGLDDRIQGFSFSLTFDFIRCWNQTELGTVNVCCVR